MPEQPYDDVDARLAGLRRGELPGLPGAAAARARGEQRTRRTRGALAGAGALATVLTVSAALALGGGDPDRQTLPPASPAPTAETTPPQSPPPANGLSAALLTAQDAEQALGGAWADAGAVPGGSPALPPPCPDAAFEALPAQAEVERRLDGPGDVAAVHLVRAYDDAQTAQRAWGTLVDDVEACPSPPGLGPDAIASTVGGLDGTGPTQAYVEVRTASTAARQVRAYALVREGALLSVVQLVGPAGEVDVVQLPPLAGLARTRARGPGDAPATSAQEPLLWTPADALLSPEQAAAAEDPGWTVDAAYEPEPGPVADACEERAAPLAEEVTASTERAMGSRREAGGSSLVQEVYRYASAGAAEDAFRLYADRYGRCADVADPDGPPGTTVRYEVVALDERPDGARALVRRLPCSGPGQCAAQFATYVLLARAGDGVTAAAYMIGEDGDPAEAAADLLVAVEDQLRASALR